MFLCLFFQAGQSDSFGAFSYHLCIYQHKLLVLIPYKHRFLLNSLARRTFSGPLFVVIVFSIQRFLCLCTKPRLHNLGHCCRPHSPQPQPQLPTSTASSSIGLPLVHSTPPHHITSKAIRKPYLFIIDNFILMHQPPQ